MTKKIAILPPTPLQLLVFLSLSQSIEAKATAVGSAGQLQSESEDGNPSVYDSSRNSVDPEDTVEIEMCKGDFECDDEQPPEVQEWAANSVSSSSAGTVPGVTVSTTESTESTEGTDATSFTDGSANSVGGSNSTQSTTDTDSTKSTKSATDTTYRNGDLQERRQSVWRETDVLVSDKNLEEGGRRSYAEVVLADEIIQGDGSRESSGGRERGSFGATGGMWSRMLRVKVTDRIGNTKLDFRVPAGFLDGLASTIPAVAGLNLKALLDSKLQESSVGESGALLDIVDRSGDRVQIFLE